MPRHWQSEDPMSCLPNLAAGHQCCVARAAARALLVALLPLGLSIATAPAGAAPPGTTPQRGGTLEFAVDAEPPNYDCHANISFAFIHPIAPHYSTLLKFDTAN